MNFRNITEGTLIAPEMDTGLSTRENEPASYLLFESRGTLCGIAASAVSEVLLLPEIAPLDGAPRWVGILDVRGRIIPVVDPGELVGGAPRRFQISDSVIIVGSARGSLGIIVEGVRDVRPLLADEIEIAPDGLVAGLARVDGEIVRLLDLAFFARFVARDNLPSETAPARPFCPDALPFERALFVDRARALRADSTATQDDNAPSLVAVRLGGELFGFDLKWVREFATRPTVTPVPGAPSDLLGLVNLRGEVVPLIDLRPALGLPVGDDPGEQITFVEYEGIHVGIAVDEVLDVFAPGESELLSPPAVSGVNGEAVRAAVFYGEGTLAVLDLCNLLQQGGWTAREGVQGI
ncbi:chemotaxis protein CheW [Abditibacteriota bacterium]|nr:chemotaxis protein CheW [Abditibacteriota bacterium]